MAQERRGEVAITELCWVVVEWMILKRETVRVVAAAACCCCCCAGIWMAGWWVYIMCVRFVRFVSFTSML